MGHMLQLLIINLVCWFFDIALAQEDVFSNAFGSFDFPITCLVNISFFMVIVLEGRLYVENGAREVLDTLRAPKLYGINGNGLTTIRMQGQTRDSTEGEGGGDLQTASVVMLSNGTPNCSMKQFMKSNAVDDVHSILLQYIPLQNARVNVTSCISSECPCKCIVFSTVEQITIMLVLRMPGTLKRMSDSMCLLPCLTCLKNGCHGCNHGLLPTDQLLEGLTEGDSRVESTDQLQEILIAGGPRVESPAAVCRILDKIDGQSINAGEPICICIPTHDAGDDKWTELLISSFKSKDAESRGVRNMSLEALQHYLDKERGRGNIRFLVHKYNIGYFICARFIEILINIILTFWFTVDGFSSSLAARRTVRKYLINRKGSGLAARAFLTKATFQFNADNTRVCQVLTFRGMSTITISYIAGGVNLICFIGWALLIAFKGGDIASPLSIPRVAIIIAAIGIASFIDCLYLYSDGLFFNRKPDYKVLLVILLEIVYIVAGGVVAFGTPGIKVLGNWVYSALQLLVWVKWVIGSCILDEYTPESYGCKYINWKVSVFSSAFLLNAALAGVTTKWAPSWPWKGT